MGRVLNFMAVFFLCIAVIGMIVMLQGAGNEWSRGILQTVLCNENEKLSQWFGGSVSGSRGRETAFLCEDREGQECDVTLGAIALIGGSFAVPFLLALGIAGYAAKYNQAEKLKKIDYFEISGGTAVTKPQSYTQSSMTVIDLRDGSYQSGDIPPEKLAQVQQIMDSLGLQNFFTGAGGNSLTERLKQIEDARREGMISEAEYQRLRQSILDSIDN